MPKTPEQWLEVASPPKKTRGSLKLFLGYAPGVGKTYTMLSEAIRRGSRGEDVIIGIVETHGRKGIAELAAQLEVVPRTKIEYKGTVFEEMDTDAILTRKPQVAVVDELAHTNIPGSKHRKRYEDVIEITAAGIDVLSTVNIQHLESIAPTVAAITGIKVRETVPDWIVQMADEAVMVDLTPEALQNRMLRGDIYVTEKVDQALKNFFRRGNLIALRELALRQIAEKVDKSLESYMEQKDIQENWAVRERIAVCISAHPRSQYLIARTARMARRIDAELFAVYVDSGLDSSAGDQKTLDANLQFAESLGAEVARLKGNNIANTIAEFVRDKHITQVIFGRSAVDGWRKFLYMHAINRFLSQAPAVDVHIITQEPD
ncbi:MAG TPA: universal stress protein [Candidatus Acidoferrales bacterium]|jgi:two-component system sensor histidine kinase KdpD|nr:universal stress protein [Candidatus Acidoferrales bacterium]